MRFIGIEIVMIKMKCVSVAEIDWWVVWDGPIKLCGVWGQLLSGSKSSEHFFLSAPLRIGRDPNSRKRTHNKEDCNCNVLQDLFPEHGDQLIGMRLFIP